MRLKESPATGRKSGDEKMEELRQALAQVQERNQSGLEADLALAQRDLRQGLRRRSRRARTAEQAPIRPLVASHIDNPHGFSDSRK